MKIAVTHENGSVFGHFGRTPEFKIYEITDNSVVKSEVVSTMGSGHSALASVLVENGVNVLICGGIGPGAVNALENAGIQVVPGRDGDTDKLVGMFLNGELSAGEAVCNCHHDHEEGHECSCHEDGEECGCHCHDDENRGPNYGKQVRVHYRGTFNDGTQFDSSYDRGETLDFTCGAGQMITGFDKAVENMEVGQVIDVHLMPSEAYGEKDPKAIIKVKIADLPGSEDLSVGQKVYLTGSFGQPVPVTVTEKDDENIVLDANSEMAGKELNFRIELVEVEG